MELSAHCLCPPLPGRPLSVGYQGGRIYIPPHDRWHFWVLKNFKKKILRHHPDTNRRRGKGGYTTKQILKQRKSFEERERKWYAQFGLEPPEKGRTRCEERPTGKALLLG